jgi:hypothetical protein
MRTGIISYGKSSGEKKLNKYEKNVGASTIVHISQESITEYSVFSIGWHRERRNVFQESTILNTENYTGV